MRRPVLHNKAEMRIKEFDKYLDDKRKQLESKGYFFEYLKIRERRCHN